jgi:hypothetical protein
LGFRKKKKKKEKEKEKKEKEKKEMEQLFWTAVTNATPPTKRKTLVCPGLPDFSWCSIPKWEKCTK